MTPAQVLPVGDGRRYRVACPPCGYLSLALAWHEARKAARAHEATAKHSARADVDAPVQRR